MKASTVGWSIIAIVASLLSVYSTTKVFILESNIRQMESEREAAAARVQHLAKSINHSRNELGLDDVKIETTEEAVQIFMETIIGIQSVLDSDQ